MVITIIAYVASAWLLFTYYLTTRHKHHVWFHWANFLVSIPLGWVEVIQKAYPPLVVTVAFGFIGAYGVLEHWRGNR